MDLFLRNGGRLLFPVESRGKCHRNSDACRRFNSVCHDGAIGTCFVESTCTPPDDTDCKCLLYVLCSGTLLQKDPIDAVFRHVPKMNLEEISAKLVTESFVVFSGFPDCDVKPCPERHECSVTKICYNNICLCNVTKEETSDFGLWGRHTDFDDNRPRPEDLEQVLNPEKGGLLETKVENITECLNRNDCSSFRGVCPHSGTCYVQGKCSSKKVFLLISVGKNLTSDRN